MIKNKNSRRPRTLAGFTLLEMIVVIAIIGVLGSIIVPSTVSSIRDSKIESANTMAYEYYSAVQNYLTDLQIKDTPICGDDVNRRTLSATMPSSGKLIFGGVDKTPLINSSSSLLKSNAKVTTVGNDDKPQKFVNGVYKYVGVTETKFPAYWVAQIDVETYTVDWVLYCEQDNADESINTLLNNYNGTQLYQAVFGKSTGTNTSQEYDAIHAGSSEKTPAYVGQYPIPYKN